MNLPSDFSYYTRSLMGEEMYSILAHALEQPQPISIRLNDKLDKNEALLLTNTVPWCLQGRYLDKRPAFTFDPLFHAGCYYVQESSSMFIEQIIHQYINEPVIALDLCAAPGGKSTHIENLLPPSSLLISNEIIRSRAQVLAENISKWGKPDVIVTNNSPKEFASFKNLFDILFTDMPCSGEGMFRKNTDAVKEWNKENVAMCASRQREIIKSCWPCLRPGGILIYSTCTFNTIENEENIQWIKNELGAEILPVNIENRWNIIGNLLSGTHFPVYRFLPGYVQGEGFFVAVLRKEGCTTKQDKKNKEHKKKPLSIQGIRNLMTEANNWITEGEQYRLSTDGISITAFNKQNDKYRELFSQKLQIIHAGITIGKIKGQDLIPSQSLALSKIIHEDAFASQDINYEQAIAYLRKEPVLLESRTPHGFVLLTYRHIPLGFVKNMGNRTNNLYPQEWRIRTTYLPQKQSIVIP